jgi:hypothetical protein
MAPGGSGTLTLGDVADYYAGILWNQDLVVVGDGGTGTFNVGNGLVRTEEFWIGRQAGAIGTVDVRGVSIWDLKPLQPSYVGGNVDTVLLNIGDAAAER